MPELGETREMLVCGGFDGEWIRTDVWNGLEWIEQSRTAPQNAYRVLGVFHNPDADPETCSLIEDIFESLDAPTSQADSVAQE